MQALDTNVLLRIVDRTNADQVRQVEQLVRHSGQAPFFLSVFVMLEFGWTLARRYKLPRTEIVQWLRVVLEAPEFVVERAGLVDEAVAEFEAGNADFGDCLIGVANLASGCSTTLTFDRDAAAIERLFSPVPS
ncbi:type II toxin-antitoxin system VapC family toxin [Bosea vestrisii]|uniref:PIN domain-containing protein n=1 Tax=Bosea vestrisii TaxID=151416 RepID=UPI0024DF8491|nr:type II toxin-antitoxin system VapC family toxin [Bosea vestrisii]WID96056.1 type II toxin-antitoxin system VapC family toxin [Bosea vestrisii]